LLIQGPVALHEAVTQNQAIKVADSVIINFVKGNINESYIPERIDGCELVQKLRVDCGDPNSLVEQAVRQYIQNGVRTRDKFKRYLAPSECYAVAIESDNNNTLFLVLDIKSQERVRELEAQALQAGRKETERLREQTYQRVLTQAEDSTMAVQQIREEEDSIMAVQQIREEEDSTMAVQQTQEEEDSTMAVQQTQEEEDSTMAVQQTQEEEDNTMALSDNELLNHEKDNAANSHILKQQIVIYFKQRVGNSDDTSKSAKAWEWTDLEAMQVPVGDPHNEVQERAKLLWHYRHLRPHNEHLKILQDKDCYKAAEDDTHHTLYLMLDSPSKRPPLRPRRPRDKKPYEKPPSAPQPRPPRIDGKAKEQVESSEMDHMDQRVRGPDQPDKEPTKFGWTDKKDSSPQIRKGGKIRKERNQGGSAAPTGSQPTLEAPPGPDPTESAASIAQAPTSQDALPDMTSIL
jgi:hypothetical protein